MAVLTVATKTALGQAFALTAAASGGDLVPVTSAVTVLARNAHATLPRTVTVKSYATNVPHGTAVADLAVTVAAGRVALIGPLNKAPWGNADSRVELTYSDGAADLTVGAYTS